MTTRVGSFYNVNLVVKRNIKTHYKAGRGSQNVAYDCIQDL
jgi:hypothetical protein